jgi:hypothetical protein
MERETNSLAAEYSFSNADANELKGMVLLPLEFRVTLLNNYRKDRGTDALVKLFANFIGMANAVVNNSLESVFLLGVLNGLSDRDAEKINTPSLFGALQGVELANKVDQAKTCSGCAFRLGTLANQSPSTTTDAQWCTEGEDKFMCHEHMNEQGEPTVPCGGHQQILKRQEACHA